MDNTSIKEDWKVVAFYTAKTSYERVIDKYLLPSLKKWKIPYKIYIVRDRGSWLANIAYKPEVIRKALNKWNTNIVYLDVDAVIECFPNLFSNIPIEADIAFHILDGCSWYGLKYPPEKIEFFNGTIFFRNNERTKIFVSNWEEKCKDHTIWEPTWFRKAIEELGVIYYKLPLKYAYIISLPDGREPIIKIDKPVIIHHQVSRLYKEEKNDKCRREI